MYFGLSVHVDGQPRAVTKVTWDQERDTETETSDARVAKFEYRGSDEDLDKKVGVKVVTDTESGSKRLSFAGVSDLQERTARHPCGDRWSLLKPFAAGLLFLAATAPRLVAR